jgi:hypothetical protein
MATRHGWSQDVSGIKPRDQVMHLKRRLIIAQCKKLDRGVPTILPSVGMEQLTRMANDYGQMIWVFKAPSDRVAVTSPVNRGG